MPDTNAMPEITLELYVRTEPSEESIGLIHFLEEHKLRDWSSIPVNHEDDTSLKTWEGVCENTGHPNPPYLVYYYGCESSVFGVASISGAEAIIAYLRDERFISGE